ncbi:hypothetical protein HZB03_02780 [Candidatus Woesearchaeota archaeon]|nr:hypothetical protein [Candidatus Woesearchaeota archaeon]
MKKPKSLISALAVALGFGSIVQCGASDPEIVAAKLSATVATQKSSYRRGERVHLTSSADTQSKNQTSA